jgi:hypothetical protein
MRNNLSIKFNDKGESLNFQFKYSLRERSRNALKGDRRNSNNSIESRFSELIFKFLKYLPRKDDSDKENIGIYYNENEYIDGEKDKFNYKINFSVSRLIDQNNYIFLSRRSQLSCAKNK